MNSSTFVHKLLIFLIFILWVAPRHSWANLSRIAVASCSDQNKPQPIWNQMLKSEPELLILAGDNIYSSDPKNSTFQQDYERQNKVHDFQSIKNRVSIMAIWDDHDYGQKDGGKSNPYKLEARTAFINNWPYLKDLKLSQNGALFHSRVFGDKPRKLQIIVLDTRFDRSDLVENDQNWFLKLIRPAPYLPNTDKSAALLSNEQWEWLEKELSVDADFRILVSSIQVIADDHQFEKWGNFPHERDRLFKLLRNKKVNNLMIVSGDRHLGAIAKINIPDLGDLFELTASSINKPSRFGNVLKDSSYNQEAFGKENFGVIRIDWPNRRAIFGIYNIENTEINSQSIQF